MAPHRRGRGLSAFVEARISSQMLVRGRVPFYISGLAHLPFHRLAVCIGCRPMWPELQISGGLPADGR